MSITDKSPLVSVSIITYNQEKYIGQAIESVLMQEVDFDYEIIIGDDGSTDGTRGIIEEYKLKYPHLIKVFVRDRNNVPSNYIHSGRRNFVENLKACSGRYIALLDGDDYWTDPSKLQNQIYILEKDSNIVVSYHYQSIKYVKGVGVDYGKTLGANQKEYSSVEDLFRWNVRIETRTMVFRNLFRKAKLPEWFFEMPFGDISLNFILGKYGNFHFLNEDMAVYRVTGKGLSKKNLSEFKNKRDWKVDHMYKWLNIWLYANHYFDGKWRSEALIGMQKFLIPTYNILGWRGSISRINKLLVGHIHYSLYLHLGLMLNTTKWYLRNFLGRIISKLR